MADTNSDNAGGESSASGGAKGATQHSSDQGSESSPLGAAADALIAKKGPRRAVMKVLKENYDLRETRREVPAGAVILTGDDATAYQAFKALNLKPDQIATALKERDDLKVWKGGRERQDQIADMAGKVGYKPGVLTTLLEPKLAGGAKLEYRDVEVETNGKKETKSVPHLVTKVGDETKVERLTAVVERDFADFLPSLKAEGAARGGTSTTSGRSTAAQGATDTTPRYPAQRDTSAKGGGSDDPVAALAARRALPSQLAEDREKRAGRVAA